MEFKCSEHRFFLEKNPRFFLEKNLRFFLVIFGLGLILFGVCLGVYIYKHPNKILNTQNAEFVGKYIDKKSLIFPIRCNPKFINNVYCLNGGKCFILELHGNYCECADGYNGERCEFKYTIFDLFLKN